MRRRDFFMKLPIADNEMTPLPVAVSSEISGPL
jgi:hypothetical protein